MALKDLELTLNWLQTTIKHSNDNHPALWNSTLSYFCNKKNYPSLEKNLPNEAERQTYLACESFFSNSENHRSYPIQPCSAANPTPICSQWMIFEELYSIYTNINALKIEILNQPFLNTDKQKQLALDAKSLEENCKSQLSQQTCSKFFNEASRIDECLKQLLYDKSPEAQQKFQDKMQELINQLHESYVNALALFHDAYQNDPDTGWVYNSEWRNLTNAFFNLMFNNVLTSNPATAATIDARQIMKNSVLETNLHALTLAAVEAIPQQAEHAIRESLNSKHLAETEILLFCGRHGLELPQKCHPKIQQAYKPLPTANGQAHNPYAIFTMRNNINSTQPQFNFRQF